jgi:hypothetical protein
VYAKTPLAGPAAVLDYLSRYTHRTAIGNERLLALDGDSVRLRVRAGHKSAKRTIAVDGETFIARWLQHVLPSGFKRIRHYGLPGAAVARRQNRCSSRPLKRTLPNAPRRPSRRLSSTGFI